jgi:hypothetical protein
VACPADSVPALSSTSPSRRLPPLIPVRSLRRIWLPHPSSPFSHRSPLEHFSICFLIVCSGPDISRETQLLQWLVNPLEATNWEAILRMDHPRLHQVPTDPHEVTVVAPLRNPRPLVGDGPKLIKNFLHVIFFLQPRTSTHCWILSLYPDLAMCSMRERTRSMSFTDLWASRVSLLDLSRMKLCLKLLLCARVVRMDQFARVNWRDWWRDARRQ